MKNSIINCKSNVCLFVHYTYSERMHLVQRLKSSQRVSVIVTAVIVITVEIGIMESIEIEIDSVLNLYV
jgi:hypothetical protein